MSRLVVYMRIMDEEKNIVGRREVLINQQISLSSMNPRGFIAFELVEKK